MDADTMDRQLKDALGAVAEAAGPSLERTDFAVIERRAGHLQWRRRAFSGAMAALVLGGAVALAVREQNTNPVVDAGPTPTTVEVPVSLDPGEPLPEPPLDVRGDAAVVWTGAEVVVWGGHVEAANMGLPGEDRSYVDGAAFDPSARRWRAMSGGPLPNTFDAPVGVSVDAGVVLVRGTATALWDPREDSWRRLGDAPARVDDLVSAGEFALSYSANARLDVATGAWTELPEPPERLDRPSVAWTGSELVVVGGPGTAFTTAAAVIYDPADDSWRTAAPAPGGLTAAALAAVWDGRRVVVVDYEMNAASYDPPADEWSELPSVPARFSEWYPSLEATGGVSVAFMAATAAVLTPQDTWVPLPYAIVPDGTPVSSGSGLVFVWGLDSEAGRNVLSAFEPAAVAASPPSVQVGLGTVPVPDGYRLADASIVGPATDAEGVEVHLTAGADTCRVTSSYFGIDGPRFDQPVTESLGTGPGEPRDWRRSRDERVWQTAATDSDLFELECDDPRVARDLAQSALLPR